MNRPVNSSSTTRVRGRIARAIALTSTAAVAVTLAAPSAKALTINVFTAGFTAAENAQIAAAKAFYEATFTDPITVNIGIQAVTSGLGESQTYVDVETYAAYKAALGAAGEKLSADDNSAFASLGASTATDPEGHSANITMKTANARAVGFAGATGGPSSALFCNAIPGLPATVDGCIGINTLLTSATAFTAGKYYFLSVLEHEMDEVLGLGSDLNGDGSSFTANLAAEDLFRFTGLPIAGVGQREFAHHTCDGADHGPSAYFSVDNGTTNLDNYNNCTNGGDYGDWVDGNSPAQVQDAFGTPGGGVSLNGSSVEVRALDVIGYNRSVAVVGTPEPATIALLATGFVGIAGIARRRKVEAK